jgi:hypothetical protein
MIGSKKKEFVLEINLESDYAILDEYIEVLEKQGYTILKGNAPVMMYNDQAYSMKSYKNTYPNQKMVSSFMVGETIDPKSYDTVNHTEETVHAILYGIFANIRYMLSDNDANVGVIYKIKIGVVYDIDEREFVLYSLLRGSFE